jgi:hypothetical protein
MANYWIVVPQGNTELFDLLSVAFRGHTGFNVVVDRRGSESSPAETERRASRMPLGPDEIVVAERAEQVDCPATGGEASRSLQHVPVRRRRVRRSASGTESGLKHTHPSNSSGAVTAY